MPRRAWSCARPRTAGRRSDAPGAAYRYRAPSPSLRSAQDDNRGGLAVWPAFAAARSTPGCRLAVPAPSEERCMRITFEVPDAILHTLLDGVPIPEMARVQYAMPTPRPLPDLEAAVAEQLGRPEVAGLLRPGDRIAIGLGSRGIAGLAEIAAALVGGLRALGAEPFVVPAMGSHGGATAAGQEEVLARLGVTEARVGAPIRSDMATEEVGRTDDGIAVRLDRHALGADGIVFVARVKPPTAFRGPYE